MNEKNKENKPYTAPKSPFVRAVRRIFFGAGRELANELEARTADANSVEEIISPGKQIFNNFMERKLAVFAFCLVLAIFLFVIIGPRFMPHYYDSYTEVTQKNIAPNLSMLNVPAELKQDIRTIDSFGSFTVGLSNSGKVSVWGATSLGTTGLDMKNIPEAVKNAHIEYIAAGIDHAIAIDSEGKVYGWGNDRLGQYGRSAEMAANPNISMMPKELEKGLDVNKIKKVVCGYQCTAILMKDGKLYIWGNRHAYSNMDSFIGKEDLVDIDFNLNYIVGVDAEGQTVYTGQRGLFPKFRESISSKGKSPMAFLNGRKIVQIAATNSNVCLKLSDGSVALAGDFGSRDEDIPVLNEGEVFEKVVSGAHHYTGLTTEGRVFSWGEVTLGQTKAPSGLKGVKDIFAGSAQSYAADENGKLLAKWGNKGYIFGTDGYGADVFKRIIRGGFMTMTIGAVAVIISSIIGVIIGSVSGYFGGRTDMVLMRVTEVFSAIPFLPFVLTLSAVMSQMALSSNMRIFIIMLILGVLSWTGLARLVRGQMLLTRESEYVVAAKAMGVRTSKIVFKHILPNIFSVILVTLTLDFATCMLIESTLSYLGFGVPYPKPSWGNMLYGCNNATIIKHFWWQWVFPSLFLGLTTISINIVGDTLRDVMDPKSSLEK